MAGPVTGRFAPSPTGPLHMGSLLTAVASYLQIRQLQGEWHVRIDDLDIFRNVDGAEAAILTALDAHGLQADAPVQYQSAQQNRYEQALAQLRDSVFYCNCPRKKLPRDEVYPGNCRGRNQPSEDCAIRLRINTPPFTFTDGLMDAVTLAPVQDVGDIIIKRRDGPWAYNFTTAIDDGLDFTHVLRGQDLFELTGVQVTIMQQLGLAPPDYTHIPVLCFEDGTKLSKQSHAPALDNTKASRNVRTVLTYLGLSPPEHSNWSPSEWLQWAIPHWHVDKVPKRLKPFHTRP